MLTHNHPRRFLIAEYPVDFRKGHFGLLSEARRLGYCPYSGDLIAFVSRDRKKVKALYGDDSGLTLIYKVFSKGQLKTKLSFLNNPQARTVTYAELAMLIEGNSYTVHKRADTWLPRTQG